LRSCRNRHIARWAGKKRICRTLFTFKGGDRRREIGGGWGGTGVGRGRLSHPLRETSGRKVKIEDHGKNLPTDSLKEKSLTFEGI